MESQDEHPDILLLSLAEDFLKMSRVDGDDRLRTTVMVIMMTQMFPV